MDDDKESKRKNSIFGGIGSSILNIFNKFSSESNIDTSNEYRNVKFGLSDRNSSVDLDKSDGEDMDIPLSTERKIEVNKKIYNETLSKELRNERSKRIIVDNNINEQHVKRAKLNDSFSSNNVSCINSNSSFNGEFTKPKCNYRSVAIKRDIKISTNSQQDSFSRFGSVQSLSESMDEAYQSTTASRISHNLFSQQNIPIYSSNPSNIIQRPITPYSMNSRRFKTVTKRDRISSYISREFIPANEKIFSAPSVTAPLSFILTPNKEDTMQRFDLSQLRKTPSDNIIPNETKRWTCNQCDTNNPIHFNFCPSCSNPNPINKVSQEHDTAASNKVDNNSWKCFRCSTINANDKRCCVFCFLAKDVRPIQPSIVDELVYDSSDCSPKLLDHVMETNQPLSNQNVFKFGSGVNTNTAISSDISFGKSNSNELRTRSEILTPFKLGVNEKVNCDKKWECPTCMLENDAEKDICVCCSSKNPKSVLGSENNKETLQQIRFGNVKAIQPMATIKLGTVQNSNPLVDTSILAKKWECPTCMVENESPMEFCICCGTKNPKSSSNIQFGGSSIINLNYSDNLTENIKFGSIFGTLDKKNSKFANKSPDLKKRECPTCMANNEFQKSACVCGNTKNPNATKEQEPSSSIVFGTPTTLNNGLSNQSIKFGTDNDTPAFKFGSLEKPESNYNKDVSESKKWECPTCMVDNEFQKSACVCCNTKNPNATKEQEPSSPIVFGAPTTLNNGLSNPSIKFGTANDKPAFKFGSVEKPESNNSKDVSESKKWECPSCMVENEVHNGICVCSTPKTRPVMFGSLKPLVFTDKSESAPKIKFGDNSGNKTFKFGSVEKQDSNNDDQASESNKSILIGSSPLTNEITNKTVQSTTVLKLSNGFDNNKATLHFGVRKNESQEMDFSFSNPEKMPYVSKVALNTDIDFEFSAAGHI